MSSPALSVLLPCRDAERYLEACIESLERQTETDLEFLAVDDGSRDRTGELLSRWAARDSRVRLLRTPGRGIVASLRLAAARARAPLLARMDADDVAQPERLARQCRYLAAHPTLAGCGSRVAYFPRSAIGSGYRRYETWLNGLSTPDELARDLFVECPIAHPSMVVRVEAYRRVGGYRRRDWPEDYDLVLRLHARGMRMGNVPELLLHWRVTPARLSARSEAYSPAAFRRCKVHFLRAFVPEGRRLVVWGAGKVGKGFARELLRQGHEIEAFVELDPRKIGQRVHGAPVVEPAALSSLFRQSYVLIAVGSPGARREIREALCELGFEELRDYRAVA